MLHNEGLRKKIEELIFEAGYKSSYDLENNDKVELAVLGIKNALEPLSFLIESDDLHLIIKPLLKFMAISTPANAYALAEVMTQLAVNYFEYDINETFTSIMDEHKRAEMEEHGLHPITDEQTGETRYVK